MLKNNHKFAMNPTNVSNTRTWSGLANGRVRFALTLRHLLLSLALALLLTCAEGLFWLLNPAQLFGVASSRTFADFFALFLVSPLLLPLFLTEFVLAFWVVRVVAQPLALLAYLKVVEQEQESYRERHTPLRAWSAPYEVPLVYYQDDPDPMQPRQASSLTPPELIEAVMNGEPSHLLLLGAPGAGKTLFLRAYLVAAAQARRAFAFGRRFKLPILLPLKYYALLLQALDLTDPSDFSLLDFLATCDLPGLEHLRPYLAKLFQQGRLLLLCDGLDEVPGAYRPALDQELIRLLRQNRNSLLLTGTASVYEQSPELIQAVGANLVPRALFAPLEPTQMREIVERFITELEIFNHSHLPTAGQVMAAIEQSRLRLLCATPFYLFALLQVIVSQERGLDPRRLDTRGRLLSAFLRTSGDQVQADVGLALDFLGELACLARWQGDDSLLHLTPETHNFAPSTRTARKNKQSEVLLAWVQEQRVNFPFATAPGPGLSLGLSPMRWPAELDLVQMTSLLDLSSQGVASFRHPLLASALLASYFARMLGIGPLDLEVIETFPDDLAPWSEPLTLWAGLLDRPLPTSNTLALYACEHPEQRSGALVLSLICLGVAQTPPAVEPLLAVPPALAAALGDILNEPRALLELAVLLMRCAERGSPELYQALFPLLALKGIESLLALLDPDLVMDLFFQRLFAVIDDVSQEALVKRLVRALSSWGEAVVPQATHMCAPGSDDRLRVAAIHLLGGTNSRTAVEPLLACLRDPDGFIVTRASAALTRLGPTHTLPRLIQELETLSPLHEMILPIIEHFLDDPDLTPAQNEQIIEALMSLLSTQRNLADQEKVRSILVSQGRLAEERASGKLALSMLVQNLTASSESVARNMSGTLKEVGQVATPHLLDQLERQPAEAEQVRILEVLASLRDARALPALLKLLEQDALAVQQALAATLKIYVPECIPGLIDIVLHHRDELVAARAEQILGELGTPAVEPVIRALIPLVAGRTHLLVHVLERLRDVRVVPALVELLESTQAEVVLTLALAQALGQLADERAVAPLLDLLAGSNPLLSEGALNALSHLGEVACPTLLDQLTTPQKTPLVARIERVLLAMHPFPGDRLLQAVDEGNADQTRYLAEVFLNRGADAAQVLTANLFHSRERIREYARQVMDRMDGRYSVPALLEALNRPEPAWRERIAASLLKHPSEAIPPLVGLLDDPERCDSAVSLLLQAGPSVLPALIPALESSRSEVQARATHILVAQVQREPERLPAAVQLFGLTLPARAHELLQRIFAEDLAEISLPALLDGLEDAHLTRDVSTALVRLAQRNSAHHTAVLDQLLLSLRLQARRYGAALTLIDLGSAAVPGVGALITDPDPEVARSGRHILSTIGTPALPFLWAAHSDTSDPLRREAAREVFRAMPSTVIKDELVELLSSAHHEEISMALALLVERLHDEVLQPGRAGEMLPALLEHVQLSNDERASLRILALLILLDGPAVTDALIDALYANPQGHTHLISAFLLLGQGVEAELHAILHDADAPMQLQAEVAGVLAMRAPHKEVVKRALSLSEHGLWAGRSSRNVTTVLQAFQLESSLRALGGLLVTGHWDSRALQHLRTTSKSGSAERELYDILLGWRYSPQITRLEHELEAEREERRQELLAHTQELLLLKTENIDLGHDLDLLKQQHEEQHQNHEQSKKEHHEALTRQQREKQEVQANLRQTLQEKQDLAARVQQATQERERLLSEANHWQEYSQQLEREISTLRKPKLSQ